LAAAGAAQADRRVVLDQLAAAAGENGRAFDQARPVLLAAAGRGSALAASIDAAIEAEHYATEHVLSVRVGSEDLRAMALSLFIQTARNGGVQ
jgi:hypothetical protein